jgi:hypothetical protein
MRLFHLLLLITVIATLLSCGPKPDKYSLGNEPRSKEASLVEVSSPCEWMIKAAGYGVGQGSTREAAAIKDLRKAAVYFVLYGGTDPLLQTQQEKDAFALRKDELFHDNVYDKFVSWEKTKYENRIKMPDNSVKIEKILKVNRCELKSQLEQWSVISPIIESMPDKPFTMVVPENRPNQSCLETLDSDPLLKFAAKVIESFLTQHEFDALVPEQSIALNENIKNLRKLREFSEDESYALASCEGSDIYLTYTIEFSSKMEGSTETKQAIVGIRAYETTSARLLGTETGYSRYRNVSDQALVEEAINSAADNVLSRIQNYWKEDMVRGLPYKLIITLSPKLGDDEHDYFNLQINQAMKEICKNFKENIIADYTLDYFAWISPQQYSTPTDIYQAFKDKLSENRYGRNFSRTILNKKLLLFKIEPRQI